MAQYVDINAYVKVETACQQLLTAPCNASCVRHAVAGATVHAALGVVFASRPALRGYILTIRRAERHVNCSSMGAGARSVA